MTLYRNMIVMYPVIALSVLSAGILINWTMSGELSGNVDPFVSLLSLLAIYAALHVIAITISFIISFALSGTTKMIVFATISFALFLISIFTFSEKAQIHLLIIFSFSLFIISLYYFIMSQESTTGVS